MVSKPSIGDFREEETVPVRRLHQIFKLGPWRVDAQRRIGTQQVNAGWSLARWPRRRKFDRCAGDAGGHGR
jgi:hypothetical protein